MLQRSLFGSTIQARICRQASLARGSGSTRPFSGLIKNSKIDTHLELSSMLGNVMKLGLVKNASLPHALNFRSFIHSGKQAEAETGRNSGPMDYVQGLHQERGNGVNGLPSPDQPQVEAGRIPRSMDYVQGLLQERGNGVNGRPQLYQPQAEAGRIPRLMDHAEGLLQERGTGFRGRPPLYQPQVESNADVVHIKLMRNNSFVTLTDSKGNKKVGVSAGQVAAKGDKPGRYSGEAAAEHIGRRVRQMKTRSVVVKVNGFTFFRRKKDAILALKDGYTNSRGDMNPVVYIEDTTRKPHNGCRLPKKRRI